MASAESRRWVALLRGVNVGGITVKSAPLAELFRSLGFSDVKTVLASGNVLFTAAGEASALKAKIEKALSDAFGYEAWIIIIEQGALRPIIDAYPFDEVDDRQPYVMFASQQASLDALLSFANGREDAAANSVAERIEAGDGVIYWEVVRGSSTDSLFAKESSKKRYKETTTTRNLRTLRKLV